MGNGSQKKLDMDKTGIRRRNTLKENIESDFYMN
jgi:hypothetical protein